MQYSSEKAMSRDFEKYLKTHLGSSYFKEWSGLFGIPDYVCFDKQGDDIRVVSFELKLSDWRQAMIQAFRYRSFSHLSYVVMPENNAKRASRHADEFHQYGIGLLAFGPNGLQTLCDSTPAIPYSPQLSGKVMDKVKKSRRKSFSRVSNILK